MAPNQLSLKMNEVKVNHPGTNLCKEKTVVTVKGFHNDTKTRYHGWQKNV